VAVLVGQSMSSTMVSEWLGRLVEQEGLVGRSKSRFPGEREDAVRHALLRGGADAMLTHEDRRPGAPLAGGGARAGWRIGSHDAGRAFREGGRRRGGGELLSARVAAGVPGSRSGRDPGPRGPRTRLRAPAGAPDVAARDALRRRLPGLAPG